MAGSLKSPPTISEPHSLPRRRQFATVRLWRIGLYLTALFWATLLSNAPRKARRIEKPSHWTTGGGELYGWLKIRTSRTFHSISLHLPLRAQLKVAENNERKRQAEFSLAFSLSPPDLLCKKSEKCSLCKRMNECPAPAVAIECMAALHRTVLVPTKCAIANGKLYDAKSRVHSHSFTSSAIHSFSRSFVPLSTEAEFEYFSSLILLN